MCHAGSVAELADKSVREQLKGFEAQGYAKFHICMAKTQYSFSTNPNLKR
jgi:formate--tetrahydrofolate ligase